MTVVRCRLRLICRRNWFKRQPRLVQFIQKMIFLTSLRCRHFQIRSWSNKSGSKSCRVNARELRRNRNKKTRILEQPTDIYVDSPTVSETPPLPPIPTPPFATTTAASEEDHRPQISE